MERIKSVLIDEERIAKVRFWATQSREKERHYEHKEIGYNYRMSNIVAGIGRGQLKVLKERIEQKTKIYNTYKEEFKEMDEITENCFNKIKQLVNMDNDYINKVLEYYPFGEDDERYNGKYLLDNTQNAKNWIVGSDLC